GRRWRLGEWVRAARRLREGDDLADVRLAGEERNETFDAEGEATVRRCTHLQRLQEPPEFRLSLLVGHAHRAEDPLLDLLAMDPDRARAELPAVPDQVVVLAQGGAGIGVDQVLVPLEWAREGVVYEHPVTRVLVLQEEREIEDPEELVARVVDQAELLRQLGAKSAQHPLDHCGLVRREQHGRAWWGGECCELLRGEKLGDRRSQLPRFADDDIGETLRAPALRELFESLELRAGERRGHDEKTHAVRVREDAEFGCARDLCRVLDLEPEADVRLVRAVTKHHLGVAEPRERARRRRSAER